ncbi:MAG TPA: hypothetical protein PLU72_09035 [Candidatus Ozemobacteraceae bacterium]|nr:hypothetical protein [Candidatus Ozemobacteraceae bacterium]HQG27246.1 hypothetical protein [Candidatus Ozemobacteraceae bacterium]
MNDVSGFLELRAIGYFFGHLGKVFVGTGVLEAFVWLAIAMLAGLAVAIIVLLSIPRILEDYVKIYNWYVNSDFYVIFEEKIEVRLVFKLAFLPVYLVVSLFFLTVNLMVRTAYHLVARLNLLRCVNCHARIEWAEGTVTCDVCGDHIVGAPTKTCPGCNAKPNAVRCPYCGFLVFIDLIGQAPTGRAGRKS